jgi:hypothetical protein
MQQLIRPFALAALALALTSTTARAGTARESRIDPPVGPPSAHEPAYGDGAEGACDLVTRAEAAKALGAGVPAGVEKNTTMAVGGSSVKGLVCQFGSELMLARFALGSSGRATFGKYRKSLGSASGVRDVVGVGDEAFTAKGQLNVRRGNTGLIIDVGQRRRATPNDNAAERALAAAAIARL